MEGVMKLALAVLLLVPLTGRANLIFVDYEGTVSYDNPDREIGGQYTVGDHVAGRLTIDTAVAAGGPQSGNFADYGPNQASFNPPYEGFVTAPGGTGYDSYDGVAICNGCVSDGAGGSLDYIRISDDLFTINVTNHDFIDNLGLKQSFDFTAADVTGPGESLSAWMGLRAEAGRAFEFVLSHVSMRPGQCFGPH
jgi:hypothetical protein